LKPSGEPSNSSEKPSRENELLAEAESLLAEYLALQQELASLRAGRYPENFRPKQLPPDHPQHHLPDAKGFACGCSGGDDAYNIWLLLSGRGFGKSLVGSTWLVRQALTHPGSEWAVFAPTFRDVRKTCIEGSTGILAAIGEGQLGNYRRNELQITLANGSVIYGYSADQPDRARGANLWGAWCDELCAWRYETTWHEGLVPALRKGEKPRIVVTTTPRPTKLIKDLLGRNDGSVHVTRGSTWENAANLSATALLELKRRYEGTRLGRQELEGEVLEDIEGALWQRSLIDADRVKPSDVPDLSRIVVAIDPAVTSTEDSDESGIVVVGYSGDHGYVLGDYSLQGTPNEVINKAIHAYHAHSADVIVAEVNNGGDWIGSLLRTVNTNIPYDTVRASRGKAIRAEPVSSLYEQHRMHHVGSFPELEDQMCGFVPGVKDDSPDRMDALVWATTALTGIVAGDWNDAYGTVKCFTCGHTYVLKAHEKCPKCGTMN
jgi:phage terminase large subunit-like protein